MFSLRHSNLLYDPDGRQGVHPLRGVQGAVHLCGAQRSRYRQRAHRTGVTVDRTAAAVRLAQLLLDQLPLLGSAVLKPDFHLKKRHKRTFKGVYFKLYKGFSIK